MKTYTYEEVMTDAARHEGVELRHAEHHHGLRYVRLYSENHPVPMPADANVDQLLNRIHSFFNDFSCILFQTDISPDSLGDQYKYLVYSIVGDQSNLGDVRLEFLGGHDHPDELLTWLGPESAQTSIAVVYTQEKYVNYFERQSH